MKRSWKRYIYTFIATRFCLSTFPLTVPSSAGEMRKTLTFAVKVFGIKTKMHSDNKQEPNSVEDKQEPKSVEDKHEPNSVEEKATAAKFHDKTDGAEVKKAFGETKSAPIDIPGSKAKQPVFGDADDNEFFRYW